MGLISTPGAERTQIGLFGRRNAGKSSLINALTGQTVAVVSPTQGTTTDPVPKSMELLPLGPVTLIDTPGYDDEGDLGNERVRQTKRILNRSDLALLVLDAAEGISGWEKELASSFRAREIPFLVVLNKIDLLSPLEVNALEEKAASVLGAEAIGVSASEGSAIQELKEKIASMNPEANPRRFVADFVKPGDLVVLVIPIDKAAPKGRLILPQQMAAREILDQGGMAVLTRDTELAETFERLKGRPSLVITDSQVFASVAEMVPEEVPLTSFSILMARYKGFLDQAVRGVKALDALKEGDRVLIAEGCTHHRQCNDIGTVKLPGWLEAYTGLALNYEWTSGHGFPDALKDYALVIHCGACMLGAKEMRARMRQAEDEGIPFTNYGTAIACMKGILQRSLKPLHGNDTDGR